MAGIGTGLRTRVSGSIGTSSDIFDINLEVRKAETIQEEKADTLMELTSDGRSDLVMTFSDRIYIIAFKCNQNTDAAIRQIRKKDYPMKFRRTGKKMILMGIHFDTEKRNISEWKWETA